ncbi:MAG: hypothetical protein H7X95_03540, partial [Deltaproteobacteria bacterium]|nr:hypothetical protein [Deltaproteobacteria bacterium]
MVLVALGFRTYVGEMNLRVWVVRASVLTGMAVLLTPACALLSTLPGAAGGITPPSVTFQGATLAQAPTQRKLEAYYCPDVVPPPFGVPGGAAILCRGFFGAKP